MEGATVAIVGRKAPALVCLAAVASVRFHGDRDQAISARPVAASAEAPSRLSEAERQIIAAEVPAYTSRRKEQTYLTLAEWSQVYSYNEFGEFLVSFCAAIRLDESYCVPFDTCDDTGVRGELLRWIPIYRDPHGMASQEMTTDRWEASILRISPRAEYR